MNKKCIMAYVIMALLLFFTMFISSGIEKNKKHPVERYNEKNSNKVYENIEPGRTNPVDDTDYREQSSVNCGDEDIVDSDDINDRIYDSSVQAQYYIEDSIQKMRIEFISYDILSAEQLEEQKEYNAEGFVNNELPRSDQTEKYLDRDGLAKESELMYKLFGPEALEMDPMEWGRLYEENAEEVEAAKSRYTYEYIPERFYYFIRIRVYNTDTSKDAISRKLNPGNLFVVLTDKENQIIVSDDISYMYNAMYTEGEEREHDFLKLDIAPGEYREVIVGMCVTFSKYEILNYEDLETYEPYVGFVDYKLIEEGVNPVLSPDMIPFSKLHKGNFE